MLMPDRWIRVASMVSSSKYLKDKDRHNRLRHKCQHMSNKEDHEVGGSSEPMLVDRLERSPWRDLGICYHCPELLTICGCAIR